MRLRRHGTHSFHGSGSFRLRIHTCRPAGKRRLEGPASESGNFVEPASILFTLQLESGDRSEPDCSADPVQIRLFPVCAPGGSRKDQWAGDRRIAVFCLRMFYDHPQGTEAAQQLASEIERLNAISRPLKPSAEFLNFIPL
jgi:hypothetical protein